MHTPSIPALGRKSQVDLYEFKVNLVSRVSFTTGRKKELRRTGSASGTGKSEEEGGEEGKGEIGGGKGRGEEEQLGPGVLPQLLSFPLLSHPHSKHL